jgi:hypothetical protein
MSKESVISSPETAPEEHKNLELQDSLEAIQQELENPGTVNFDSIQPVIISHRDR